MPRARSFHHELDETRRRLRWAIAFHLLLALGAGFFTGMAFRLTLEPAAYEREVWSDGGIRRAGPSVFGYEGQVAGALLLLSWANVRRMRRAGDKVLLGLVSARPLAEQRLANTGEEMAIAAGVEPPRLRVAEIDELNAFSCSPEEGAATITVTRGLLDALTRDELQAVVAHELAHIEHGDTKLYTLLIGLSGTLRFVAVLGLGWLGAAMLAARQMKSDEMARSDAVDEHDAVDEGDDHHDATSRTQASTGDGAGVAFPSSARGVVAAGLATVVAIPVLIAVSFGLSMAVLVLLGLFLRLFPWLVAGYAVWELMHDPVREPAVPPEARPSLMIALCLLIPGGVLLGGMAFILLVLVAPAAQLLMRLFVARNAEYRADARAVELTRNPLALAQALTRIREAGAPTKHLPDHLEPAAFAPIAPMRLWRRLLVLFDTHPPLASRIERIRAMAG